jgi:hypothetical protein
MVFAVNIIDQLFQWLKSLIERKEKPPVRAYFHLYNPAWNDERITYKGVLKPTSNSFMHYLDCRRLGKKEAIAIWNEEKKLKKQTSIPTHYIEFFYRSFRTNQITFLVSSHYSFVVGSDRMNSKINAGFNSDEIAKNIMRLVSREILEIAEKAVFPLDAAGKFKLSSYEILSDPAIASTFWRNMIEKYFEKLIERRN